MAPRLSPPARRLLLQQRGIIASWQAPDVGLTSGQLARAAKNDWQRVTPRTFLSSLLEPSPDQLRVAALLEGGPDAMLSGCSALREHGWNGDDGGFVDVLVARDHRFHSSPMPGWLRWRSTTEVPRSGGVPVRVAAARATIDAATWARTSRERMFILTSVVQQRITTVGALRRDLTRRGRQPWAGQIREILDEVSGGVSSMGEAEFLRQCRRWGLPKPRLQVRLVAGGRRRVIDAEFRRADGRAVIVEIDGLGHLAIEQWQEDLARQNAIVVSTDAILLRVSNWQVRTEPESFFPTLIHVLDPTTCLESIA